MPSVHLTVFTSPPTRLRLLLCELIKAQIDVADFSVVWLTQRLASLSGDYKGLVCGVEFSGTPQAKSLAGSRCFRGDCATRDTAGTHEEGVILD